VTQGFVMTRRRRARFLPPIVLLAVFCCNPGRDAASLTLRGADPTDRVRVFLIAPADGGQLGRKVACADSAVSVEVALAAPQPALEGSLAALLALPGPHHPASGLYNALYASPLTVERVERRGPEVRVRLAGYVELAGPCDGARLLAQLTETALQFPDVQHAVFWVGEHRLADLVSRQAP
jgi:hypothetical protein